MCNYFTPLNLIYFGSLGVAARLELTFSRFQDPVQLINNEPTFIKKYSLIVASELPQNALLKLGDLCHHAHIPLLVLNIYGFVGWLRTVLPEHDSTSKQNQSPLSALVASQRADAAHSPLLVVVESKPDFPPSDLRISNPFPELLTYVATWDFEKLNSTQHAHIPFPVILVKAIEAWKASVRKSPKISSFHSTRLIGYLSCLARWRLARKHKGEG
jgi:NEDD8-activating enzyme E1 regulatory subunit